MDDRSPGVDSSVGGTAATGDTDERTRELRSEIEQTREEISETIDAIQEKLRPGNIAAGVASATTEKVKDMAYSAADRAEDWWESSGGSGLAGRIRNNPVPAGLACVGLVWLASSSGRRAGRRSSNLRDEYDYPSSSQRERHQGVASDWQSTGTARAASAGMEDARRMARRARSRLNAMIRQNPLAVGAAAAILGAALGLAIPETERENELMGEARDTALERAQEAAHGAVDRVKDAAADVVTRAAVGS